MIILLSRIWWLLPVACLVLLSHPFDATWYDENYAQLHFISLGPYQIFSDYHLPNNHILYSLSQWVWQQLFGFDVFLNRLSPLLATMLAIPGLYLAGRSLWGPTAGVLAALLFSTSHIVGDFSSQLRGYGLTLGLLGLALGFACAWYASGFRSRAYATLYVVCGALAIGVIPTNAIFVGVISGSLFLIARGWRSDRIAQILAVLLFPLAGFVTYLGVWDQLDAAARVTNYGAFPEFVTTLTGGLLWRDMPWAAPLIGLGIVMERHRGGDRVIQMFGLLCIVAILLPVAGAVPAVRTYLPLVLFLALMTAGSLTLLVGRISKPEHRLPVMGMLVALIAISALGREAVLKRFEGERWQRAGGKPMTLVDQYFHSPRYNPDEVIARIDETTGPQIIVTTHNLYWDLAPRLALRGEAAVCVEYRGRLVCVGVGEPTTRRFTRLHIIHRNQDGAMVLLSRVNGRLGLGITEGALRSNTSPERYFKLWSAPVLP